MPLSRRRKRATRDTADNGISQPPFAQPVNLFGPISIISEDELENLHQTSLRLLRDTGVEVLSDDIVLSAPVVTSEMAEAAVEARSAAVVAAEEIAVEAADEADEADEAATPVSAV